MTKIMTPKKDKELCDKYPDIFRDRNGDMKDTCMCWGISCGDGWFKILDGLLSKITYLEKKLGFEFVADQVKEKFGGLRFYYHIKHGGENQNIIDDICSALISDAEHQSMYTCEECGEWNYEGTKVYGWWVKSLCEKCATKLPPHQNP